MQTGYWKRQNSWTFSPLTSSLQAVLYIQGSFGWRMREKTTSIPACTVHTKYGTCTLIRLLSLRWRCRYLGIRMHLYTKMFLLYILSRWPSKEFQVDEKDSPQGPYDLEKLESHLSSSACRRYISLAEAKVASLVGALPKVAFLMPKERSKEKERRARWKPFCFQENSFGESFCAGWNG